MAGLKDLGPMQVRQGKGGRLKVGGTEVGGQEELSARFGECWQFSLGLVSLWGVLGKVGQVPPVIPGASHEA